MWLIVGLGNPGEKYASHRHNVGFQIVHALAKHVSFPPFRLKGKSELSEGEIAAQKVVLMKPLTFMNLSGPPVASMVSFYKIPLSQVIVIHDELALESGKIRFKRGGSAAGHNGLKSLVSCLGDGFSRLRIGIGHPGDKSLVTDYVLSPFLKSEKIWLVPLIEKITREFPLVLTHQEDTFVSRVMQPS